MYTETLVAQISDGKLQLGGLFDSLRINVDEYKEVLDKFKSLDLSNRNLFDFDASGKKVANWDKIAEAIGDVDDKALSYFKTLDDGNGVINNQSASIKGMSTYLQATGQSFNFAAIKATLFNTALNAGIMLAVSIAIQVVVKAVDNYVHRVEKARERTAELFDEFKELNDTLEEHKKTVKELADRYDKLAKGVDLSTNKNKTLSTDEYEEFLDINKQLAESFPSLSRGIDENGNSILSLGTNGITAKKQLEELLKTEEDLNNFRIGENLEESFAGVLTYIEEADEVSGQVSDSLENINNLMSELHDVDNYGIKLNSDESLIFSGSDYTAEAQEYMGALIQSVEDFRNKLDETDKDRRIELDELNNALGTDLFELRTDEYTGAFEIYSHLYNLDEKEIEELERIIQENVKELNDTLNGVLTDKFGDQNSTMQEAVQQAQNSWIDFLPNLVAKMKSAQTFKNLDDSDLQDIAVKIVEGLDYSYAEVLQDYDPTNLYAYIRDNFIDVMDKMSNSEKEKLKNNFSELFKLDANDISQYNQEQITKFITEIADLLGKDPVEMRAMLGFDVADVAIDKMQNSITQITSKGFGAFDLKDLADLKDYTKDFTLDEIELWLEATLGAKNATDAVEMYKKALENAKDAANETPTLSFTDAISQVQSLSKGLDQLDKIYADVFDKKDFDWSSMLNNEDFKDVFSDFKNEYNDFIETVANSPDDIDACQSSFNKLATAYLNSSDAIKNLTDETKEATITMLEQMGIANAEEFVNQYLISSYGDLKEAAERLGIEKQRLFDLTREEINQLLNEDNVSEETKNRLIALYLAQLDLNKNPLDTKASIDNLRSLIDASSDTADALVKLANIMQKISDIKASIADGRADKAMLSGLLAGVEMEASALRN